MYSISAVVCSLCKITHVASVSAVSACKSFFSLRGAWVECMVANTHKLVLGHVMYFGSLQNGDNTVSLESAKMKSYTAFARRTEH